MLSFILFTLSLIGIAGSYWGIQVSVDSIEKGFQKKMNTPLERSGNNEIFSKLEKTLQDELEKSEDEK